MSFAYVLQRPFDDALGTLETHLLERGFFVARQLPLRSFPNDAEMMEAMPANANSDEIFAALRALLNEFPDPPERQIKFRRI